MEPEVYYSVQKNPPISLSWGTSSQKFSLRCTIILSFQLRPSLPSVLFPSGLTTKIVYACPFFPICANCLTHIILLYLIALILFGEVHKSWNSSKCSCIVINTGNVKRHTAWDLPTLLRASRTQLAKHVLGQIFWARSCRE